MGQSCAEGAMRAAHRKGIGSIFPNRDAAVDGDVTESGDAGGGPGKSSLFSLTARNPEIGSSGARVRRLVEPDDSVGSGAPSTALENPRECNDSRVWSYS